MWINSKQREEPYLGLTCIGCPFGNKSKTRCLRMKRYTGAAWLSSARAREDVGLSPLTSETLIVSCQRVMPGTLARLPALSRRKVRTTSSHHGLYAQGCHTCYNGLYRATQDPRGVSKSHKAVPQFGLRVCNSTSMKLGIASNRASATAR